MTLLLDFDAARIARADGSLSDPLTLNAAGPRVTLVGRFDALFALLSGAATLGSGRALVAGIAAERAVASGHVGLAPLDPELPTAWTAERYLVESALLMGLDAAAARAQARDRLQIFELVGRARQKLGDLLLIERLALMLAAATLGRPTVLCAEAPLYRLDAAGQAYVQRVLERAVDRRPVIVSIPELAPSGPERGLVDLADQVSWEHGRAAPNSSGSSSRYTAAVLARGAAWCAALEARGIRFQTLSVDPVLLGIAPDAGAGACRVLVELPDGASSLELVRLAAETNAPLVELVPV